jgi:hypothetical protein
MRSMGYDVLFTFGHLSGKCRCVAICEVRARSSNPAYRHQNTSPPSVGPGTQLEYLSGKTRRAPAYYSSHQLLYAGTLSFSASALKEFDLDMAGTRMAPSSWCVADDSALIYTFKRQLLRHTDYRPFQNYALYMSAPGPGEKQHFTSLDHGTGDSL